MAFVLDSDVSRSDTESTYTACSSEYDSSFENSDSIVSENDGKECESNAGDQHPKTLKSRKRKWSDFCEEQEIPKDPVEEKKRIDDLWKNFLEDAAVEARKYEINDVSSSSALDSLESSALKEDSETFISSSKRYFVSRTLTDAEKKHSEKTKPKPMKVPKKGGLDFVVQYIEKKQKSMKERSRTVFANSVNDWKEFKVAEKIEDELKKYNKGKGGYIQRQRFLESSDWLMFENERKVRQRRLRTRNSLIRTSNTDIYKIPDFF